VPGQRLHLDTVMERDRRKINIGEAGIEGDHQVQAFTLRGPQIVTDE
jgi:hypothetical protein